MNDSVEILFQSFLQEQFWHEQEFPLWRCPSSMSSADRGSPTLQGALKDGYGEAVVACDMPEPVYIYSPKYEVPVYISNTGFPNVLFLVSTFFYVRYWAPFTYTAC